MLVSLALIPLHYRTLSGVFGAVDPNSGSAVLLEVARGLSLIMAHGWRPARTIVLVSSSSHFLCSMNLCSTSMVPLRAQASWDGEEQGLIGST